MKVAALFVAPWLGYIRDYHADREYVDYIVGDGTLSDEQLSVRNSILPRRYTTRSF